MINSIFQKLQQHSVEQKDKVAFYLANENSPAYTYGELIDSVEQYREFFERIGVAEQSIVACALGNGQASLELTLGVYASNRILLPLNLVAGDKSLEYILQHAEPCLLIVSPKEFARINALAPKHCMVIQVEEDDSLLNMQIEKNVQPQAHAPALNDDNINSLLMYTSGTTGNPKGVLLSAKNLLAGGKNTSLAHQLSHQDIGLCVLPLYHINAQCVSIMSTIDTGSSLVLAEKFSVSLFFPLLKKYAISWASMVPTMLVFLLNAEENKSLISDEEKKSINQHLRFIRSASAPLPIEIHNKVEQWLDVPIIETMGITEASAQILSNPLPPEVRKIGSVGLGYGNEVQLLDKKLNAVAVGEEGEVCVRGDNVMRAYYKNPEATASAIEQGWLRTGDLAKMDEDGYFYISGRSKELIIKGGENIAPREIDEVLYMHEAVIEGAAFAVPCSNYGQKVEVCIKKETASALDEAALIAFCQQHLGTFKSPDKVHFIEQLPKGPSGKIQRLKLYETIYG